MEKEIQDIVDFYKEKREVEDGDIVKLYLAGILVRDISKILSIAISTIYYRLKKCNVKFIGVKGYSLIKVPLEKIVELYKCGMNAAQIAQNLNIAKTTVEKKLRSTDIWVRPDTRKYTVNDDFFSEYNPESCYWAGFIAADGNVTKNKLRIELNRQDEEHLEKFKNIINYSGLIFQFSRKYTSCLAISSKKIVKDLLNNFNIVEAKSLILRPPTNIKEEFINHFIRGYIDGDGTYRTGKRKSISIIGTNGIVSWVKEKIKTYRAIGNPSIFKVGNIYSVTFGGEVQCCKISDWIFNGSEENTRLERKYNKMKEFNFAREEEKEEMRKKIINLYVVQGKPIRQIQKILDVGYVKIKNVLNKNNIAIRKDYKKILKKEKNDKIIKLYVAEKITVKNIANSFGIEITTIKRILKENNIKIFDDKEKHYSEVSDDTLLRLYNDGLSYSKIARTVQIHRTTVKNRLIKLGVL